MDPVIQVQFEPSKTTEKKDIYRYQPLQTKNETRVLQLLSKPDEELRCRVLHIQLPQVHGRTVQGRPSMEFIAFSYEWGDPSTENFISVVGPSEEELGILPLTNNLNAALCNFRDCSEVTENLLWIDQISINQLDLLERGHHVGLMRRIYPSASKVISYLGPEQQTDYEDIALLRRIFEETKGTDLFNFATNSSSLAESISKYTDGTQVPEILRFNSNKAKRDRFLEMIYGSWTRRLWMAQETCLNQNLFMLRGIRLLPWEWLVPIITSSMFGIFQYTSVNWYSVLSIAQIRQYFYHGYDGLPLITKMKTLIIFIGSTMHCSDGRDHIYGLMGLASDLDDYDITIDYTKSENKLYLDIAVQMMKKSDLFPLEAWNPFDPGDVGNRPSWVPCWKEPDFNRRSSIGARFYQASGMTEPLIEFYENTCLLEMVGMQVATVVENTGIFQNTLRYFTNAADFKVLLHAMTRLAEVWEGSAESLSSTFCRTIRGIELPPETTELSVLAFEGLQRVAELGQNLQEQDWYDDRAVIRGLVNQIREDCRDPVLRTIDSARLRSRSLCITENKFFCLTSHQLKPGDIVALLLGGNTLYALRPVNDGSFIYLGDVYMDGAMNGEILSEPDWEDKLERFILI